MEYIISFNEWLQANPGIAYPVFVLAVAAILAIGVPGGNVLMISSGLIFGTLVGGLLALVGGLLAAFTTHAVIRTAFGNWLDTRAHDARAKVRQFVTSGNFLLLVIPRLIPVIPFFVINVGFTAAGVPKKSYMLSTLIGMAPIVFLLASIGEQLGTADALSGMYSFQMLFTPAMLIPLSVLLALTFAGWLWVRNQNSA